MLNKKRGLKVISILLFLLMIIPVLAQTYDETVLVLDEVEKGIQESVSLGLPITRINDTYFMAKQLFDAQQALQASNGQANYFFVMEQLIKAKNLLELQIEANDELKVLKKTLQDVNKESKAQDLFVKAETEFKAERYENVATIIDESYKTISEENALDTRVKTFYLVSTQSIINFFKENWRLITSIFLVIMALYVLLNKKIRIMLIDRKILNIKLEINVLKNMIKKTQEEYFHLFNIPEELYFIRVEKFGEFIRKLNSELPLLLEKKANILGVKETGEKIPLKERIKNRWKLIFEKKPKEKKVLEMPKPKEEKIKMEYKKSFWFLLKNFYSLKRLKVAYRERKLKKAEKKHQKEVMKNMKKSEIMRKKEEEKRMKKIIKLKEERDQALLRGKRKEKRVLFWTTLFRKFRSLFKKSNHIKLKNAEAIKNIKKKNKEKISKIDRERKEKEQEYLWLLLKQRDKKEEPKAEEIIKEKDEKASKEKKILKKSSKKQSKKKKISKKSKKKK